MTERELRQAVYERGRLEGVAQTVKDVKEAFAIMGLQNQISALERQMAEDKAETQSAPPPPPPKPEEPKPPAAAAAGVQGLPEFSDYRAVAKHLLAADPYVEFPIDQALKMRRR